MTEGEGRSPRPPDFRFGEYRCPGGRQALLLGGRDIAISTKPYHLLRALLGNAGQVVSKEQLCEAAWPGQIVTDAALARQMARLRRLIDDTQRTQPLIETHRGLGYRFTGRVEIVEPDSTEERSWQASSLPLGLAAAAATALVAGAGFWWWSERSVNHETGREPAPQSLNPTQNSGQNQSQSQHQGQGQSPGPPESVSVALVPAVASDDWLSRGGIEYLAERLSRETDLEAIVVSEETGLSGSADAQAVHLTSDTGLNYAAQIGLSQSDEGYDIDLVLRTGDAVLGSTLIGSNDLASALVQATDWLRNQVAVHRELDSLAVRFEDEVDPYALQSYLLAVAEQQNADQLEVAREYLQAAVNKDPDFLEAWLRLASVELELGENQRAVALAEALLERAEVQSRRALESELELTIGLAYGRMKQDALSRDWLSRAAEATNAVEDPLTRLKVVQAIALAAQADGRHEEAIAAGQEALTLAEAHLPLPNVIADLHVSLGAIFTTASRHAESAEQFEAALPHYQATGNTNGVMRVYYRLNNYYYTVNRIDEGVQVVHRATPILDKTSLVHEKAFFLYISGLILNLRGFFEQSDAFVEQLRQIATTHDNPMHALLAEFVLMHRLYVQEEFQKALVHARSIAALAEQEETLDGVLADTTAVMMLLSARAGDANEARRLAAVFEQQFGDQQARLTMPVLRAKGHLAALEGDRNEALDRLRRARTESLNRGEIHVAAHIGYEMLEFMLQQSDPDHRTLLRQLERETEYDYSFWKVRARFLAQSGDLLAATALMTENRLRAGDLWDSEDQLLLEAWKGRLAEEGLKAPR